MSGECTPESDLCASEYENFGYSNNQSYLSNYILLLSYFLTVSIEKKF